MKATVLILSALVSACHAAATAGSRQAEPEISEYGEVFANPYSRGASDCRSFQTLTRPAELPMPHMGASLWRIRACPSRAGVLLAALLDSSRAIADTIEIDKRTRLTQHVHADNILNAAIAVAVDTGATTAARLAALRTMVWSKSPGILISLTSIRHANLCVPPRCFSTYEGHFYGPFSHHGPVHDSATVWPIYGKPMESGYSERIDRVFLLIAERHDSDTTIANAAAALYALRIPQAIQLRGR